MKTREGIAKKKNSKEKRTSGYVQVTVQGQGFHHSVMIPARGPQTFFEVSQQVNYARSLAA